MKYPTPSEMKQACARAYERCDFGAIIPRYEIFQAGYILGMMAAAKHMQSMVCETFQNPGSHDDEHKNYSQRDW
jgi:hypothetical protein